MPKLARIIELYTCDFKCGHKADIKYKILKHESICFCNPINKACRICKYCESSKSDLKCNKLKLFIMNKESNRVYDFDNALVWTDYPQNISFLISKEELMEIEKHNSNRPFPTKNCQYFINDNKKF